MSWFAGVDIGSSGTKIALWDGGELKLLVRPTGWNPRESAESALHELAAGSNVDLCQLSYTVVTGYGRGTFSIADAAVTEIICLAAGAAWLTKDFSLVLDIGGQDSKVILVDARGKVADFLMNDKCAAGTGRFIQNMAALLGYTLEELANIPEKFAIETINSMCTVFAESEVISLISKGIPKESIALGILDSVAMRAAGMAAKFVSSDTVVFTGGTAQNTRLVELLERRIGRPVRVSPYPQFAGAIGAAVIASEKFQKQRKRNR